MAGTKTILAGVCEYVDEYKSTYVRKLYILRRYLDRYDEQNFGRRADRNRIYDTDIFTYVAKWRKLTNSIANVSDSSAIHSPSKSDHSGSEKAHVGRHGYVRYTYCLPYTVRNWYTRT